MGFGWCGMRVCILLARTEGFCEGGGDERGVAAMSRRRRAPGAEREHLLRGRFRRLRAAPPVRERAETRSWAPPRPCASVGPGEKARARSAACGTEGGREVLLPKVSLFSLARPPAPDAAAVAPPRPARARIKTLQLTWHLLSSTRRPRPRAGGGAGRRARRPREAPPQTPKTPRRQRPPRSRGAAPLLVGGFLVLMYVCRSVGSCSARRWAEGRGGARARNEETTGDEEGKEVGVGSSVGLLLAALGSPRETRSQRWRRLGRARVVACVGWLCGL